MGIRLTSRHRVSRRVPITVFVSAGATNSVLEFPTGQTNPKPIARIKDGISIPLAVATDANGTLYVLNSGVSPATVTEYPSGQTKPSKTLTLTGYRVDTYSDFLAVGPDGTVYINVVDTQGNTLVVEFYRGATQPSLLVYGPSSPPAGQGFIGVDRGNNLYVTYYGGACCGTWIEKYPLRSTGGTAYAGGPVYGGITFDGTDNMLVVGAGHMRVLAPSGKEVGRFTAPPANAISFDSVHSLLYTEYGTVTIIDYSTKKIFGAIGGIHDATSVAVSPNTN